MEAADLANEKLLEERLVTLGILPGQVLAEIMLTPKFTMRPLGGSPLGEMRINPTNVNAKQVI